MTILVSRDASYVHVQPNVYLLDGARPQCMAVEQCTESGVQAGTRHWCGGDLVCPTLNLHCTGAATVALSFHTSQADVDDGNARRMRIRRR